jgi:NAD(P)-dependent dehydrogenase (short-subunit alcohol dehydrogenase family)
MSEHRIDPVSEKQPQEDGHRRLFSPSALAGKVVLITGAGRGLGKTMAHALAACGADLVLTARSGEQLAETVDEIEGLGKAARAITADVTNSDDVGSLVEAVISDFGRIDVLVNNAGLNAGYFKNRFEEMPEEQWREMIETNVTGVFLVSKLVGATMLERGAGKIINIGSLFGVRGSPLRICYSVSKAAVIQMTKTLAAEWAERGVTVNCLCPGSVNMFGDSSDPKVLEINETRRKTIPLGRLGEPGELGPILVYLASDAADYMTGETILIDGGWVLS